MLLSWINAVLAQLCKRVAGVRSTGDHGIDEFAYSLSIVELHLFLQVCSLLVMGTIAFSIVFMNVFSDFIGNGMEWHGLSSNHC